MADTNIVKCHICKEDIDLNDKEKALKHTGEDQAHKDHTERLLLLPDFYKWHVIPE